MMKKRAVSDEEKQEKQQAILDVTASLFAHRSFEEISMAQIAEAAGIAKGTVFLYFATKEELFLKVAEQYYREWVRALLSALNELPPERVGAGVLGGVLMRSLRDRPDFMRLLAILHTRIESNIAGESGVRYRKVCLHGFRTLGEALRRCCADMSGDEAEETVAGIYMLIIAVQNVAVPSPAITAALKDNESSVFALQFEQLFPHMLIPYLRGRGVST